MVLIDHKSTSILGPNEAIFEPLHTATQANILHLKLWKQLHAEQL